MSLPVLVTFLAVGVVTLEAVSNGPDAPAAPSAPTGVEACKTLRTPDNEGVIDICKTWTHHSDRKGYYGTYWGTVRGRNVVLEGYFDGWQKPVFETGERPSAEFTYTYQEVEHVYFRACRPQQTCTGTWW